MFVYSRCIAEINFHTSRGWLGIKSEESRMLGATIQGRVSQSPQIVVNTISGRNVCSFHCCSVDTANLAASDHSDIAQGASETR